MQYCGRSIGSHVGSTAMTPVCVCVRVWQDLMKPLLTQHTQTSHIQFGCVHQFLKHHKFWLGVDESTRDIHVNRVVTYGALNGDGGVSTKSFNY